MLRIVGGTFRGRKLKYARDQRVRPMKDRTREALFNLLGPAVQDMFVVDLFGGTGALAFEALSRGASEAVIVEQHLPTAKVVAENAAILDVTELVTIVKADTFHWAARKPTLPSAPHQPWLVFCSPPYRLFAERTADMIKLITSLLTRAPTGSLFAVEATREFDFSLLPLPDAWQIRAYPPAVIAIHENDRGLPGQNCE